jgi:multiple sugar transport system substrate-binding protein
VAPAESTSAAPAFDPTSVSGDLTLQGWSAGAVEAPILDKVLEDFEAAYPNIKVKFEPIAGDYAAAMAAKFSSQDVPDVFYVDSGPAATWIDDGSLELDDYIAKSAFDTSKFYPAYLDAFKGPDGKLYGLPKDGNTIAMAYNSDMLTAAGVTAPPTTWEELTAAVDKLKGQSGLDAPLCLSPSLDRALAFIYQAGGGLFNEDKTAAVIDTLESVAGIDT